MPNCQQPRKALVPKESFLDITGLIRSIQHAEGNPDCFHRAHDYCSRLDCAWRAYCLEKPQVPPDAGGNHEEE